MENIIEFQNVSFRYESDTDTPLPRVIEGLNFTVHRGEFVAVLGHNGSGKSTLAKLCNAILLPEEGRVLVDGMDTAEESLKYDIRQTVGMVFQNPDNQIVATIVEEDVAFGPENLGVEPQEIRRRVDDALRAVEMYEFREKEPHRLSGGQKQRVAIAGIIAMRPDCIVLDEPTAMLDPRGRAEVLKTIRRLNREQGITIVLITHFMDEAVRAGRVVVMDDGKILMDGTPREVFSHVAQLKQVGLDVPQAAELADALNREGWGLPEDILTVEECVDALATALKPTGKGPQATAT